MTLYVDSDAAYLVAPKAKSRIAGFFYCSNKSTTTPPSPPLKGPFYVECKILRHVVTSVAEAKTAGLFYNCQTDIHLQHMLNVLGHPQKHMPVKTDNGTTAQFASDTVPSKINEANHGTFVTIGLRNVKIKVNLMCIGTLVKIIWPIIIPSITVLHITEM